MLDLSKPVTRIEKRDFNDDVIYVKHLTETQLMSYVGRIEDEEFSEVADCLIIEAVCKPSGESCGYTKEQLSSQPFSLRKELAELIMEVNTATKKKDLKKPSKGGTK